MNTFLQIREIQSNKSNELDDVYRLTHNEYVRIGYIKSQKSGLYKHYEYLDHVPQTTVFGAFDSNNQLIGTNSLTIDGPQKLCADNDFPDQVNNIRQLCKKYNLGLGSSWRLIINSKYHNNFKVLLELIRATIYKGCKLNLHITLYVINPRHENIYRKQLGLITIKKNGCKTINNIPAVLMMGDSRKILSHCAALNQSCIKDCHPVEWPKIQIPSWTGMKLKKPPLN